ncbi:MAG: hypothetical protein AAF364_08515 [Pseudomonadota bacterium]
MDFGFRDLFYERLLFTIFIILILWSNTTLGSDYITCNYCNTQTDYQLMAKSKFVPGTVNSVYVMNFESDEIVKFYVSQERARDSSLRVVQTSVEPDKRVLFTEAVDNRRLASSAFGNATAIPSRIADSVYDIVGASYLENDVVDYYSRNQGFFEYLLNYTAALASIAADSPILPDTNFVVPVTFDDGSRGFFKINGAVNGDIIFEFTSGVDADNNYVSKTSVRPGSYRFTRQGSLGVERFKSAASRIGFTISGGLGSPTRVEDGDELICDLVSSTLTCSLRGR